MVSVLFIASSLHAQVKTSGGATDQPQATDNWNEVGTYLSKDSLTKNQFTLLFYNKDTAFLAKGDAIKQKMIDAFFNVYPKEANRFNRNAAKTVIFIIDPSYKGVAATSANVVRYSPVWMLEKSNDIDVVTHEVMHIVQAYPDDAGPGWLTEGIADYVRYKYGVSNAAANWTLPALKPTHNYTNSYRITARFLDWVDTNYRSDVVTKLDSSLRTKTYNDAIWNRLTGKSLDELWANYIKAQK